MKYKDYYKILGVNENASHAEIKKAYRKLAKEYHPDTHPGDKEAEKNFKEINEAYEVLGNEEKRKKYDQLKNYQGFQNGAEFDPSQFGFNFSNSSYETNFRQSSHGGFSDFFEAFFGDGAGFDINDFFGGTRYSSQSFQQQPSNVEAELNITLEEAYHGKEKKFMINLGNQDRTLSVKIPAGILSGERVKLKGQGFKTASGNQQGDLILNINVKDDKNIKLEGLDIHQKLYVSPWEAALGAEIKFESIAGGIKVKIPSGSQSGKKLKLSGKGYRDRKGRRGDLYIEILIKNPYPLSEKEKRLYESLREVSSFNPRM
ncbi:MAG: J domain-containing protein [Tindallia sp. MSAO_Bac2]|nr:MAG: J domain-containing protein [Tindallia sp. MSAO_Bac2]